MSDSTNEHRLPPPAFPPGQRRHVQRNATAPADEPIEVSEADGLIAPDQPIPHRRDPIEQAFISPDEPIPERKIELAPEFAEYAAPTADDGEGEVVGMDLDAHLDPLDAMAAGDPYIAELTGSIARLAADLERRGEAGLRTAPGMSRFDATLRSYCVGYLAGRRAEESMWTGEVDDY